MASLSIPNNPTNGQLYTGPNSIRYQYSTTTQSWTTTITTASAIDGANPGVNAPLNPVNGTFWLDTDSKSLYVYHTSTSQWLSVSTGTSADVPGLALEGV